MTPKITDEMRDALQRESGRPVTVEDEQSHEQYVLVPLERFQKVQALLFDTGEFDPREAYPLLDKTFGGPEGWDAPGMEAYDTYDQFRPKP